MKDNKLTESLPFWLFFIAILCIMFLLGLSSYGIIDPSDGIYSECAREMLERHDYITPYFNYTPFYEKPILIYWLIILAYKCFGIHEWSARLPSVLSAMSVVTLTFLFVRRFTERKTALLSTAVFLSTPLFLVVGHLALTDTALTLFLSVALFCFFGLLNSKSHHPSLLIIAYINLALSVILKGPIAILLSCLIVSLYILVTNWNQQQRYQIWWQQFISLNPLLGLVIVTLIALPWYVAEIILTKGEFFNQFFIVQNVGRALGAVNHQNPWYYYLPCLMFGFFPWSLFPFIQLSRWHKIFKKKELSIISNRLWCFCLCWFLTVVVFFSILETKLYTYILPAVPPMAILTGLSLRQFSRIRKFNQPIIWSSVGVIFICAILVPYGLHKYYKMHHAGLKQLIGEVKSAHGSLCLFMRDSPAANFYLQKKIPIVNNDLDLAVFCSTHSKPYFIMISKDSLNHLILRLPCSLYFLDKCSQWYLFRLVEPHA